MSIFTDVFVKKPGRSLFNLSHEKKFTANFGYLYPFLVMDCVPGDTIKMSSEFFVRTAPLVAPVMHRINVKINYFFVPNRLLWEDWENFITGVNQNETYDASNTNNGYFSNPVKPFVSAMTVAQSDISVLRDGSLMDFLGFPTLRPNDAIAPGTSFNVDMMPFYAYNKIYADWYRNQNVEGGYIGSHGSGEKDADHSVPYMRLRKRMYEKDYFTSALPFAQRGEPVPIPVTTAKSIKFNPDNASTILRTENGVAFSNINLSGLKTDSEGQVIASYTGNPVNFDNSSSLEVDANSATIGNINDLRIATRLQRWLEKNARVGGRYIEQILAHFGVHSSDARLQRAEYLGGYSVPIQISEVEQNNATIGLNVSGTDTPQGHLAGKGSSYGQSKPIKCFCEEHGWLIGLISILPRTSYQDGVPRMYKRSTKYDYYFPEFANLGEQDVTRDELFFDLSNRSNQDTSRFGFQERYCEYKYIPSTVHGEFKNNLQFWHLGRSFSSQPVLNKSFVEANPRNNIFAVEDNNVSDHFYIDLYNNVSALRPMPKQAIPTL